MSMNNMTAVEYIESCIDKYMAYHEGDHKAELFTIIDLREAVKEAKEMEKQQIIESYRLGHIFHDSNDSDSAEEYYNTEYGKQ